MQTSPRLGSVRTLGAAVTAVTLVTLGLTSHADASPQPAAGARHPSVTRTGTLVEVHGDDFVHGREHEGFGLQGARPGRFAPLVGLDAPAAERLVGRRVSVTGTMGAHGRFAVSGPLNLADGSAGGATSTSSAATTTAASPTTKQVAVVLVAFADAPSTPVTADAVRSQMFTATNSVNAYYQDLSGGAWTLAGDVFGYYTINRSSATSCDYSTWGSAARTAATNAGVDLTRYTNTVYVWPAQSSCAWSGMGQLPGNTAWINGNPTLRVLSHELGHNFGEHHASSETCTVNGTPVPIPPKSATCSVSEYGDPFSVMGASSSYLQHNAARAHYGFIAATTVTSGVGGTFDLVPAETTSGTRLVRVPRGDGSYLSLEFRQPAGIFDTFLATAPVANGVSVRIDYGTGTTQTRLLDMTPFTSGFSDAPLAAGQSVSDPLSGATITVDEVSATGARVTVTYGADTTAPSTPTGLTATASTTAFGAQVQLSWAASSDNVGVAGYRVARDGISLGTAASTTFTDDTVAAGQSHVYTVAAVDGAGNASAAVSGTVLVPVYDCFAPSPVTGLQASVRKNRTVALTWSPSSDNIGVTGYVVGRNGAADRTMTTTSASERVAAGTYTYTVKARDAAGNLSTAASITVTLK